MKQQGPCLVRQVVCGNIEHTFLYGQIPMVCTYCGARKIEEKKP